MQLVSLYDVAKVKPSLMEDLLTYCSPDLSVLEEQSEASSSHFVKLQWKFYGSKYLPLWIFDEII